MVSTPTLKILLQLPVFEGLKLAEAHDFFVVAAEQRYAKGQVLFAEDEVGESVLVVLEGSVSVTKRGVELARFTKPTVLGEMSLVSANELRTATAIALTEVLVLTVPSKRVKRLLKTEHIGALKVVANLAAVLAKRLAAINDKLVGLPVAKQTAESADFDKILNDLSL